MEKKKQIEEYIAKEFGLESNFVNNKTRKSKYVLPKKLLCNILYYKEELTLCEISQYMGFRDHSTIIHHLKSFDGVYETNDEFKSKSDKAFEEAYNIYFKNK